MAYKKDVGDVRESPALDIIELLLSRGAEVRYTDPYVPTLSHAGHDLESVPFDLAINSPCECAVIATDHKMFDFARIAGLPLVVDTRNALRGFAQPSIFRL